MKIGFKFLCLASVQILFVTGVARAQEQRQKDNSIWVLESVNPTARFPSVISGQNLRPFHPLTPWEVYLRNNFAKPDEGYAGVFVYAWGKYMDCLATKSPIQGRMFCVNPDSPSDGATAVSAYKKVGPHFFHFIFKH